MSIMLLTEEQVRATMRRVTQFAEDQMRVRLPHRDAVLPPVSRSEVVAIVLTTLVDIGLVRIDDGARPGGSGGVPDMAAARAAAVGAVERELADVLRQLLAPFAGEPNTPEMRAAIVAAIGELAAAVLADDGEGEP